MSGFTDADTAAEAIDYTADGFQSAKAFEQTTIAADGSTVVKIYYDRKTYTAAFVTDGGALPGGTDHPPRRKHNGACRPGKDRLHLCRVEEW